MPALESARAESLLAYLLIHRDAPQPRQRLAFLLWPDSSEPQARTNLRHVLHNLRRALPEADDHLEVTPRTLQWRPDSPLWLDLHEFEAALDRGELRTAVDLYSGDLLTGCYDDWVLEERERVSQLHLHALERLVGLLEERGEHAEAIRYAERLLRHDPLREDTYRRLMRLHDARGDRVRALRVYHACTGTLERELGVEPSTATRAAYEALLPTEGDAEQPERAAGLVGRAGERARLTELWRASERGHAQLVLVTGEPGVGKTRLVEELRSWCAHRGAVAAEARSYFAEGALAYAPVAAWLRSEPFAARRGRLDPGRRAELARVLPELAGESAPPPLPEAERRRRLFDALAAALLAPGEPTLLVADDLHWADADTLQFLHYLIRTAADAPLLVLSTARREDIVERHPLDDLVAGLRALDRVADIELGRLPRPETAILAERVAGRSLDAGEADRIFAETEGNPLFVVETVRAGGASPRVHAVLEARLAQLSDGAHDLAALAATIGREFTSDLLGAASGASEEELVRGLDELWRRRIVRERGVDAYDFSHDKLREAAYAGLGPARRGRLHLRVARALERLHADDPGLVAGRVAAHYDRAGAAGDAVSWYELAAREAQRMYANREAIRLLERGLELAAPDRELALLTALLVPLAAVEGAESPRLIDVQRRAVRASGGESAPPLLRSIALTSLSQGRFDEARRAARELQASDDDVLLVEGDYLLGISAFWQGELEAAREHFEAAVERSKPEHRTTHLLHYGLDPTVVCLSRLGNTLAFLGDAEGAIQVRDRALALAEEIGHPNTTGTALVFAALLALELRDEEGVREYAAALSAVSASGEAKAPTIAAEAVGGYVDVLDGRIEPGLARIDGALDEAREAQHAPGQQAAIVRILLEACAVAGDAETGIAVAERALAEGMGGVRLWEADTRRRLAEFRGTLAERTPRDRSAT